MSISRYALGVAALIVVLASLAAAAATLRRRYLPQLTGATAALAAVVIGSALLVAIMELLGAVGLFSLAPLVAAAVAVGAAAARIPGRPREAAGDRNAGFGPPQWTTALALAAGGATLAEWAIPTLGAYDAGIRTFDSLWYHLPWAASFAQSGQITSLRFTDVEYLTAFYPATAELVHGLGIVLLARDTLSPAINLMWLGLVLLAAYCVGAPRGAGALTALGAALALATPMMVFSQAGSAANDVVGVFFLLAAVALLSRAERSRFAFALAAVAAGLAAAVKLSMVIPALALTVAAIWLAPAPRRRTSALLWIAPALLAGGFWYLRNLIAVGNPVPWLDIPGLATPAPALQQHTGFSVAHYLIHDHVAGTVFSRGLADGLGPWWTVIVALAALGPLLCLLPGSDRVLRLLALVALASLVGYVLTPESAAGPAGHPLGFAFNLRYSAPALALCLTVLGLAPVLRAPARAAGAAAVLGLVIAVTLAQSRLWPSRHLLAALVIGFAAAVAASVVWRRARLGGRRLRLGRGPLVSAGAAAVIACAAGGYLLQRHYLRGRYVVSQRVSHLAPVWVLFRHMHNERVGVAGTFGGFFSYPLFGVDDSNRVRYVAHRGPHGAFLPITSCSQWRAAVNAGRFTLLVTTPARDPWRPGVLAPSPEGGWTASDRAVHLVFRRLALGQPIAVYAVHGRLDPGGCRR